MNSLIPLSCLFLLLASCAECPDGGSIAGAKPPKKYARYCGLSSYGSFTKHGPYKEWYLGTNKIKYIGQYYKGRKTGDWQCFSREGFEVEQSWRNGELVDGPVCEERVLRELAKSMREKSKGKKSKK